MPNITSAACRCGKVQLQIAGEPILRGICYCKSCQQAGRLHQAQTTADTVLTDDGGTDYVLYRKDRVRCLAGGISWKRGRSRRRRRRGGCSRAAATRRYSWTSPRATG